jgi:flagellar basal-body rod modification protein FlgD
MTTPITGSTGSSVYDRMAAADPTSAPGAKGTGSTGPIAGNLGVTSDSTQSSQTRSKTEMDKDLFLKLLVAQLKYQDPTKPTDSTQFLSQTAQFTMVEKVEESNKAQQQLLTAQLMTSAAGLVGRSITFLDAKGEPGTGVVTAATISGSSPTVKVGNTDVPLSSVTEVRAATP